MLRSFLQGATLILSHDLETDLLEKKISHISMVPTQLYRLLLSSRKVLKKASSLTSILVGGAPIGKDLLTRANKACLPIHVTYGLTELGSSVFIKKNPKFDKEFLPLGFPLSHLQAALSEDNELYLKGFSLFQGYYQDKKAISPLTKTGWFKTHDLVHFDPVKGYSIIGRKDNQFISGGENIQPEQIEQEIMSIPQVVQALVVPIKDSEFGHRPVAFVSGFDKLDKLKRSLENKLPKYKIPAHFFDLNQFQNSQMKWKRADLVKIAEKKINEK